MFLTDIPADDAGFLRTFDACSGLLLHSTNVGTRLNQATLDPARGRAFIAQGPGLIDPAEHLPNDLLVLDTRTGRLLRHVSFPPFFSPVTVGVDSQSGQVFVLSTCSHSVTAFCQGSISIYDEGTGRLREIARVGFGIEPIAIDSLANRVFAYDSTKLDMFNARTGALLRAIPMPSPDAFLADRTNGRLYVVGTLSIPDVAPEDQVVVLDGRTGQRLHTLAGYFPLVLDRGLGQLIVPCNSTPVSPICVYDTRTWRLIRRIDTADHFAVRAVDEPDQELVATSALTGKVGVLDARTGSVLATLQISHTPTAGGRGPYALQGVAVDGQTGRAFVVDAPDQVDAVNFGDDALTVLALPHRPAP